MPSTPSKILDFVLRNLNVKNSFDKIFNSRRFGKGDINSPPKFLYKSLDIIKVAKPTGNFFILNPKKAAAPMPGAVISEGGQENPVKNCENEKTISNKQILYLHGGGYVHGFNRIHWMFLKTLTQELNCKIIAPDYPVAPEFTFHEAFEMVIPIYKELISKIGKENVVLMGDSSGGGFALALAQKMCEQKFDVAGQIILISPWLDITLKNNDINAIDSKDPILGVNGLRRAGLAYAGEANPENYMLSPINGSVEGLGKISIFAGTKDILIADIRKFKSITMDKGIDINYYEYEDMLHVWPLFNLPESKLAIEQIKQIINNA